MALVTEGSHCRVNTFVNIEEKQSVLEKKSLSYHVSAGNKG